jgi:predicted RNA-binding protein YlqC (UPF0109 family)
MRLGVEMGMKDLVEYIVQALVDNPDEVSVHEIEESSETILELTVADADMGRVIGKSGRVINSIRSIVQVLAAKQGRNVSLEVIESH